MSIRKLMPALYIIIGCVGVFGFTISISGGDEPGSPATSEQAKIPDAKKTVGDVSAQLTKATEKKSYNVICDILGGISKTPDNKLDSVTMAVQYIADIYRGTMKVTDKYDAYRLPNKGVMRDKRTNAWMDAFASQDGRELMLFFPFPHEVLRKSLAKAERVEWVWVGDEQAQSEPAKDAAKPPEEGEPKGTTHVDPKGSKSEAEATKTPHLVRLKLSPEAAASYWTDMKNSNRFAGKSCSSITEFLGRADASRSEGYLEIDLEKDMVTPKSMSLVVLVGICGADEKEQNTDLASQEHIAFRVDYKLSVWDAVDRFVVPPEAQKILR